MSNQQDFIFVQVQEMFPQIDADVIYMVLSEHNFQVNHALQSLTILTQTMENTVDIHEKSSDKTRISSSNNLKFGGTSNDDENVQDVIFGKDPSEQQDLLEGYSVYSPYYNALQDLGQCVTPDVPLGNNRSSADVTPSSSSSSNLSKISSESEAYSTQKPIVPSDAGAKQEQTAASKEWSFVKNITSVMSYVAVGKLNGIALIFVGGDQRNPVITSGHGNQLENKKLFNEIKIQLHSTQYSTNKYADQSNGCSFSCATNQAALQKYRSGQYTTTDVQKPNSNENTKSACMAASVLAPRDMKAKETVVTFAEISSNSVSVIKTGNVGENVLRPAANLSEVSAVETQHSSPNDSCSFSYCEPPTVQRTCTSIQYPLPFSNMPSTHSSVVSSSVQSQYKCQPPSGIMWNAHQQPLARPDAGKNAQQRNQGNDVLLSSKQSPYDWRYTTPSYSPAVKEFKPSIRIMYLLRGAPGSGKSTLARKLCKQKGVSLSADDLFYTPSGYVFDPTRLSEAHAWNQQRTEQCLMLGRNPVVIDNTNTTSWEMRPYMSLALKHCYKIEIMEPNTPWKFKPYELWRRNSHGVSKDSIKNMLARYEKNVTVESVLGKDLFLEYQRKCLKVIPESKMNFSASRPCNEKTLKTDVQKLNCNQSNETARDHHHTDAISPRVTSKPDTPRQADETSSQTTSSPYTQYPSTFAKNLVKPRDCDSHRPQLSENVNKNQANGGKGNVNKPANKTTSESINDKGKAAATVIRTGVSGPVNENLQLPCDISQSKLSSAFIHDIQPTSSSLSKSVLPRKPEKKHIERPFDKNKTVKPKTKTLAAVFQSEKLMKTGDGGYENWSTFMSMVEPKKEPFGKKQKVAETLTSKTSASSMTEDRDFIVSNKVAEGIVDDRLTILNTSASRFKPSVSTRTFNTTKPMFEKSTTTDGLETDNDENNDLATLGVMFPDYSSEYLSEIYTKCDKQLEWATNIIAEASLFDAVKDLGTVGEKSSKGVSLDAYYDMLSSQPSTSFSDQTQSVNHDEHNLQLNLPEDFVKKLFSLFGDEQTSVTDCVVDIDQDLASQIYDALKNSLKNQVSAGKSATATAVTSRRKDIPTFRDVFSTRSPQELDQLRKDEELARMLQAEEDKSMALEAASTPPNTMSPNTSRSRMSDDVGKWSVDRSRTPDSLSQIIDEETAAYRAEKRQLANIQCKDMKLATQLKREELHAMFHTLPSQLLDDIFAANNFNLEESMIFINCIFCEDEDLFYKTSTTTSNSLALNAFKKKPQNSFQSPTPTSSLVKRDKVVGSAKLVTFDEVHADPHLTYNHIRTEANLQRSQMHECQRKAAIANHQKKGALATYYAQQAHQHQKLLREANQRAAAITYRRMNDGRSPNELDLHGLHVDEAIDTLRSVIRQRQSDARSPKHLFVITGRGLNSTSGIPRVKNAVTEWLKSKDLRHELLNEGYIKVLL